MRDLILDQIYSGTIEMQKRIIYEELYWDLDEYAEEKTNMARMQRGISQDIAYVLYTSGSTGIPKRAILSY